MDAAIRARIEGLREIIEDEPDDELGHFMLAQELSRVGEHAEAAAHFRAAIALKADYTAAFRGLGKALTALGRPEEAREIYHQGLVVAEQNGDLQTAREMEVFLKRLG
jgi:uncharacterized protein HemY